ncbi:hypothetical protein ACFY1V_19150 [Streptomyces sp. NPDC001255]|uniref:hypothetical protein n=2 Tax=unclassified Streptomyces TaxID=2593676 RepID=UPI0036C7DE31
MSGRLAARWVIVVGVALFALSAVLYAVAPDDSPSRQVELTVISEKKDGACDVRWTDPFTDEPRSGHYRCDPDRGASLKPHAKDGVSPYGTDYAWAYADRGHRGELIPPDDPLEGGPLIDASDTVLLVALLITLTGLVWAAVNTTRRLSDATLRRARDLATAAARLLADHRRATAAVVTAWAPLHEEGVRARLRSVPAESLPHGEALRAAGLLSADDVRDAATGTADGIAGLDPAAAAEVRAALTPVTARACAQTVVPLEGGRPGADPAALLGALRVLVAAGPQAGGAVAWAADVAARLTPDVFATATAPPGAVEPRARSAAKRHIRQVLATVDKNASHVFTHTSADLVRGAVPGDAADRHDVAGRPSAYYAVLDEATLPAWRACAHGAGAAPSGLRPRVSLLKPLRAPAGSRPPTR